jgi:hypothetical protein
LTTALETTARHAPYSSNEQIQYVTAAKLEKRQFMQEKRYLACRWIAGATTMALSADHSE